ncbi:MAG: bifunctional metallophosphatase/5'-nucleotidase [Solobacterium sp.]|nr:bifunctional metallophosphatase/5'-nucleotidase [Solobacterium sp.]MCH4205408.1 bifunctional metallophosphatase/5'-nucleotidase [Solobacterium sp.]MCH4226620.1 bifunctional metallophosphatase/5'-nucleotidase [Solobacterium sp.]MCH4282095.1 bifunctional metallophosphatase/5'-nucleotidase [Solobacterium sp.]
MNEPIRLLVTSDVHGLIYPYSYADGSVQKQGFGQLYTLVQSLRTENTLLLDNGDSLAGSPLSFFHYLKHADEISPITAIMHEMQYDYINVGNHDFNYGEDALMMHLQNVGAPCITNNYLFRGVPYGPNYVIREIAGKKLALIGVTTQYTPHWENPAHIKHSRFEDAFENLKKNVELVKKLEKPDYIIALYHGGFERDFKTGYLTEEDTGEDEGIQMMRMIPDLDILLAGHQHHSLCGTYNNIVYTETSAYGMDLACVDIDPDTGKIEARMIPGDGKTDDSVLSPVQKEEDECQLWLDQTLGTSNVNLKITDENDARLHKSQLITFFNQVQMEATGAEISATALFLNCTGFNPQITMRNLISSYVYPNTLTVKKMTGKILREYLEKDAEFWSIRADDTIGVDPSHDFPTPQHYNYDMLDGVDYTIKVSNPIGQRITSLTYQGKDVEPDQEFTVCINNYRAAGGGNFSMIKNCPTVSVNLSSMVELLAEYILKHKVIDFEPVNNISVIK